MASARELSTACKPGSLDTERPERFVMPKAVSFAVLSFEGSPRNCVSVALAPGKPPST